MQEFIASGRVSDISEDAVRRTASEADDLQV